MPELAQFPGSDSSSAVRWSRWRRVVTTSRLRRPTSTQRAFCLRRRRAIAATPASTPRVRVRCWRSTPQKLTRSRCRRARGTNGILVQCDTLAEVEAAQVVALPARLLDLDGNAPGSFGGHPPPGTQDPDPGEARECGRGRSARITSWTRGARTRTESSSIPRTISCAARLEADEDDAGAAALDQEAGTGDGACGAMKVTCRSLMGSSAQVLRQALQRSHHVRAGPR